MSRRNYCLALNAQIEILLRELSRREARLQSADSSEDADAQVRCYSLTMRSILPFAAVLLAIFAAGCIAYLAWEVTKEASREGEADDD